MKIERAEMILGEGAGDHPALAFGMESPQYGGRVISAMWDDPDMMELTGKTLIAAELGERYDVSDLPGHHPKSLREVYGSPHAQFDLD